MGSVRNFVHRDSGEAGRVLLARRTNAARLSHKWNPAAHFEALKDGRCGASVAAVKNHPQHAHAAWRIDGVLSDSMRGHFSPLRKIFRSHFCNVARSDQTRPQYH